MTRHTSEIPESGRLEPADHDDASWHAREVLDDFELIDAWRLPCGGAYEEFPELAKLFLSLDLAQDEGSKVSNFLFAARMKLGEVMGWDEEPFSLPIPGCKEKSLRDRLSIELRQSVEGVDQGSSDLSQLVYLTNNESIIEISNSTVHAAIHIAWVPTQETESQSYFGQMGIYVKTRGTLGRFYMPAIAPFRHYIVYPALMRRLGAAWQSRARS